MKTKFTYHVTLEVDVMADHIGVADRVIDDEHFFTKSKHAIGKRLGAFSVKSQGVIKKKIISVDGELVS